jgi:flagella basal body P-ring formation protein FlgA
MFTRTACRLVLALFVMSAAHASPADTAGGEPLQDAALVTAEVESFLRTQAETYPGSVEVAAEAPRITRQRACSALQPFLPSGQRLRSRMTVGVRCAAPDSWTLYVQANLGIQGYYYVANRSIQVGDLVSLDDLAAREGDLLRLSSGVVFDPSQVVGHIATQRVAAGSPLKSSALRSPDSVQRGQMVRTEARGAGFVASGEGQALQSGAPGVQIQVKSSSGQIVTGTVLNASTVLVLM